MNKIVELKQIGKLTPSKDFKEQARKRLMQKIVQDQASWLEVLLRDLQKIKPERSFSVFARERLLNRMLTPEPWGMSTLVRFFLNKKIVSIATAFAVLFLSIVSFSVYTPQTVEASNTVYLVITTGNPIIKPLGKEWQMAQQLQELNIGDTIQTDENDIAEIHFFDNSITRMAHNTELTITTFFKENYNEKIEIELNKGRTWNKVIQAFSNPSDFTMKTHNSSVSTKNATFDVVAGENQPTAINVMDRLIDVEILQAEDNDKIVAKTKVAEGYKVEVQVSAEKTIAQTAQITPIEETEQDLWMTDNLAKDKIYLDDLEKKREEKIIATAGILPNSPLYKVKQGFEGAKNVITNSDETTEEFEKMQNKFQEAAALSTTGEAEASELALAEFKTMFLEIKNKQTLKTELEKMLFTMQNNYTTVLPGSQDYKIKELLRELELEVAQAPEDVLLKRTTEKLFEAQDLMENGSSDLAVQLLAGMSQESLVLTSTGALLEEDKKAVILQKTEELQILQTLKENAKSTEGEEELMALVDSLHQNAVQEIGKLVPKPEPIIIPPKKIVAIKKEDPKVKAQEFMDKIHIYKTQKGQDNQLLSLLNKMPENQQQVAVLIEIKKLVPVDKQYLITQKILEITEK